MADVHGNLEALEAVIADMLSFDVDEVLCLGDVAAMGPDPAGTVARLRSLGPTCVLGNTDAYLSEPRSPADVPNATDETAMYLEVEAWCAAQLSAEDHAWLRAFAPHVELDVDGCEVVAYHGSPHSYDDPVGPETPHEHLARYLGGFSADLYLGAHIHHQFMRRYLRSVVANPGSVGMAFHRLPDGVEQPGIAEYALLRVSDGQPNLHFRRVPYDLERLRDSVTRSGMPHPDLYLERLA